MIIRTGRVLWWLGVILGVLISIGGIIDAIEGHTGAIIQVSIIACFCVLVGRGARYILSNE